MQKRIYPYSMCLLAGLCIGCHAYAQTDSLHYSLDSVEVVAKYLSTPIKGSVSKTLYWDMKMMQDLPQILGNADPLHYTQLLPGVQTSSEYDAGLHILGCENGHNLVAIDGVPVYNASHLLGFFSIFNASHFPMMRFEKAPLKASAANRLGGTLDMIPVQERSERISGELSVGPMSSQGTLRTPVGRNGTLHVSLRAAYLNLLYGRWLKVDDSQLAYGFQDYNATYLHQWGDRDKIWLNFYYGSDDVSLDDLGLETGMKWNNCLASLRWQRTFDEGRKMSHTLYWTQYRNRLGLDLEEARLSLDSHIRSYGYQFRWNSPHLTAGLDAICHDLQPQDPGISGKYPIHHEPQPDEQAQEYIASIDYTRPMGKWTLAAGLKSSLFARSSSDTYFALDPTVSLQYAFNDRSTLALSYGWQHQYLSKAGFSNMGLPTEFWFSSGNGIPPQYAQSVHLSYETKLFNGNYSLTLETYYKDMHHQLEYNGTVLDFLSSSYHLQDVLLMGKGENYGINAMLNKRTGKLTGWLSFAWGRAFRTFDKEGFRDRYPAAHERIYELNAVATYRLNHRWSLGGTFVLASGTPFTAPKHIYLMNGQLVTEFGPHHANRLKTYSRLDLSVNYTLRKEGHRESGLNFSLYNALAQDNDLFYRIKIRKSQFYYNPVHFIVDVLPSISYYCKF